ncbi:MAG: DNA polymerase III subunit gamma/tau [Candidatus Gastranaerophilales bacterium]|nr:DNA polymerase III subunit gamma/tau [Candidatus Gastranaerophilales bacterium]
MSEKYIPLYRKYRPKNLEEVVGQEHIKHALANAIKLNKISHAYLFTGPRGTGKTSVARILAKSLNCKEGPTLTPCEVCPSCVDITNSTPMDVIEIDAASNRKVEDAQNILEKIQYIPVNGKYKIYIIDEVHMLTTHAFNALLKTLEEPPENVIFILATTEPQKVLETITSRCQRFDFRRITTDDIINHLKNIAKSEKIKIDDDALFTIAKNSAGGMRDSLALLDQVSVLDSAKSITSEDVNKLLGRLSFDMLKNLSNCIIQSKPQEGIELLEEIYNSGNEPTQILTNLLGYLKNLLIVKNCSKDELLADLTQLNSTQIKILKEQCEKLETHQITFLIEKTAYYIKEVKTTTNQHLWLEIGIIDLANLAQNTSLLDLQERISRLEGTEIGRTFLPNSTNLPAKSEKVEIKQETEEEAKRQRGKEAKLPSLEIRDFGPSAREGQDVSPDAYVSEDTSSHSSPPASNSSNLWFELLQAISSPPVVSLLSEHARPVEMSEEKVIIGCEKEIFVKMLSDETKKKVIADALQKIFNKDVSLIIRLASADETLAVEKKIRR